MDEYYPFAFGILCGSLPVLWYLWSYRERLQFEIEWQKETRKLEVQAIREYYENLLHDISRREKNGQS